MTKPSDLIQFRNTSAAPLSDCSNPLAADRAERWHVVYTQAHAEALARRHLQEQGFKAFLPRFVKNVRHARQVRKVYAPLFPRYLFVAFDPGFCRWRAINCTRGVTSLLTQDGAPAAIASDVIDALLARSGPDEIVRFSDLRPGQQVRVLTGPFAEQIAVLERLSSHERVRVLLDMAHRKIPLDLVQDAVSPL